MSTTSSISNINITTTVAEDGELHCGRDDLTGTLGLFVQALLAFIAFGALVSKSPENVQVEFIILIEFNFGRCGMRFILKKIISMPISIKLN